MQVGPGGAGGGREEENKKLTQSKNGQEWQEHKPQASGWPHNW